MDDIKNLIKNGREILETRKDIIKAYRNLRGEHNLAYLNDDDDDNGKDDDGKDDDRRLPEFVRVSRERFDEISKEIKMNKNNKLHSKVSKKTFYLTDSNNLIGTINNLTPNSKLDNEII